MQVVGSIGNTNAIFGDLSQAPSSICGSPNGHNRRFGVLSTVIARFEPGAVARISGISGGSYHRADSNRAASSVSQP